MTLNELCINQIAVIEEVIVPEALYLRLRGLGLRIGVSVCVRRCATFNGPIHISIGTTELIMRRDVASFIKIKQIS